MLGGGAVIKNQIRGQRMLTGMSGLGGAILDRIVKHGTFYNVSFEHRPRVVRERARG